MFRINIVGYDICEDSSGRLRAVFSLKDIYSVLSECLVEYYRWGATLLIWNTLCPKDHGDCFRKTRLTTSLMVVFKICYPVVVYTLIQPRAGGGFLWHIWLVCPPLAFYDPDRYSAKLKDQGQTRDIKVWRLLTNDGHHRRIFLAAWVLYSEKQFQWQCYYKETWLGYISMAMIIATARPRSIVSLSILLSSS